MILLLTFSDRSIDQLKPEHFLVLLIFAVITGNKFMDLSILLMGTSLVGPLMTLQDSTVFDTTLLGNLVRTFSEL